MFLQDIQQLTDESRILIPIEGRLPQVEIFRKIRQLAAHSSYPPRKQALQMGGLHMVVVVACCEEAA
jgi:hypothetical protein